MVRKYFWFLLNSMLLPDRRGSKQLSYWDRTTYNPVEVSDRLALCEIHQHQDMVEKQTTGRKKKNAVAEVSASLTTALPAAGHKFASKTERRGSPQPVGKPHRITYDCTKPRYRQLKLASMNTGESMNAIISSAIDDCLAAHPEVLEI